MATFGPTWWHHHGVKMMVKHIDKQQRLLVIKATAAEVGILPIRLSIGERWIVLWEVKQSQNEGVNGRALFTPDELRAAFGLPTDLKTSTDDGTFFGRPGVDFAVQGKFARRGNYLNIPCTGTGHDGDPNVSIEVTEEMQEALRQLLK